jgi:hypothetical protein
MAIIPGSAGYPLGTAAAVVVTILTVTTHATDHPLWSVLALAVAAATIGTVTTLPAALATAAVCWALHAGFVLGRRGDLNLSDESAAAGALLSAVTVFGYLAGVAVRTTRRRVRTAAIPLPTSGGARQQTRLAVN